MLVNVSPAIKLETSSDIATTGATVPTAKNCRRSIMLFASLVFENISDENLGKP
jgi:hypothetical protein